MVTAPTLDGAIPVMFSFVSITGIAVGDFVLARRFGSEPLLEGNPAVRDVFSEQDVERLWEYEASVARENLAVPKRFNLGPISAIEVVP